MNSIYSLKTRRAIAKYGDNWCLEAYRMNFKLGEGARTIAATIPCSAIRTSAAANAAINAGREIYYLQERVRDNQF